MTELPPPPPPPQGQRPRDFHLPGTNFFLPVRAKLTALERPPEFKSDLEVPLAFLIAFVTGGILGVAYPLAVNGAFSAARAIEAAFGFGFRVKFCPNTTNNL